MNSKAILFALAISLPAQLYGQAVTQTDPETYVGDVSDTDAEMNTATQKARESFSEFEEAFVNCGTCAGFLVKSLFTDEYGKERMWVSVSGIEDGQVLGTLDSAPVDYKAYQQGDDVRVSSDTVYDWAYYDGDEPTRGHFTTRVHIDRLPADEAAIMKRLLILE